MKKLFISQPMKDKTDEQILAERDAAIEEAKRFLGEDVEVIDSFFKDEPAEKTFRWSSLRGLSVSWQTLM